MTTNSLETFVEEVRSAWGPLSSELIAQCSRQLGDLLKAPTAEEWLAALHGDEPANKELHRDAGCGFMLLAHTEQTGLYRPPHDHGRSWVIYGVQRGEVEMGTYIRMRDDEGHVRLVKRDATLVRAGEVKIFLPGDIHDTRAVSGPVTLLRFPERDLKKEGEAGLVTRYVDQNGVWTVKAA